MEFLYLSPEFPPNYAHFVLALNQIGVNVWAIGEAAFYDMPERLRSAMKYYVRANLHSTASVETAVSTLMDIKRQLDMPSPFDRVESHNENWLSLEARINDRLGIDGIRPADLDRLRKKSVMKRIFREMGLPTARGECIRDLSHALALADRLGYPLILKPDQGVGAAGIHKVSDETTLRALVTEIASATVVLEEFVDAPIVSYDGLSDTEGRIVFESSLVYGDGVLDYVLGKDTFFYVNRRIPDGLVAVGRRLVQAFDVRGKFFHFEFFRAGDTYMPIEINCRPPGGAIIDMMNYSMDGDLYEAYARMISRKEAAPLPEKTYCCGYFGRRDRPYRLSHGDVLAQYGDRLVEHGENPPVFQGAMGRYRYIVRFPSEANILETAQDILDRR